MIALGLDLIMPDLVQAQRVEPHRVLGVVLAPAVVGHLAERLERVVVSLREPAIDQPLRGPLRLGGAEVGGLEDGAQDALGRDRMVADEVAVADQHAAEVLRPRLVGGAVEDHVADLAGAQLLRLGRKAEEGIDLALGEQLHRRCRRAGRPSRCPLRVEPDIGRHDRQVQMCRLEPSAWMPTLLPFRSLMVRMGSCANSSKQPACTPASAVIGSPASRWETSSAAKFEAEIDLAARDHLRMPTPGALGT